MNTSQQTCNIMTFDLEEWFHILDLPSTPDRSQWRKLESRIEIGLNKFLEAISDSNTSCTFFVLGWIATRYPDLVKRIASYRHEIGAHGFAHELITRQDPKTFREDIRKAKIVLEDLIGKSVTGYRGPGFSITDKNTWAFELILSEGFEYDATLFAGRHGHGGMPFVPGVPFRIITRYGDLEEFPVPTFKIGPINTAFSGGGYFRLLPGIFTNSLIRLFNSNGKPVLSYLHPRDLDPDTPRLSMPLHRKMKCYININKTFKKLKNLVNQHSFVSISNWRKICQSDLPRIDISQMYCPKSENALPPEAQIDC